MRVHLVDGTYELFRHFFALPEQVNAEGEQVAAIAGVVGSMLGFLESGVTHLGVATDHVIESFRNELYGGYKTGDGIDPKLWSQFHPLEEALRAMGVVVWDMVEFEADDALASAARVAAGDARVEEVLICTPDKDLAQSVVGRRVVQFDRRKRELRDEAGVITKFGVPPSSIPDYLALVGDSADGYPGIPGWGPKASAALLAHYGQIDRIPVDVRAWAVTVRGADRLAASLNERRDEAMLYRTLATLRTDAPVGQVDDWQWRGPTPEFVNVAARLRQPALAERAARLGVARGTS